MKKTMINSIETSLGRAQVEAVRDTYGPNFNAAAYANLAYEIRLLKHGPQRPIVARIISLKKQMMKALKDGNSTVEMEAEARNLEQVFRLVISKKWRRELFRELTEKFEEQAVERALSGDMPGAIRSEKLSLYYGEGRRCELSDYKVGEGDIAYVVALHALQCDNHDILERFQAASGMSDEDIQTALEDAEESL